MGQGRDFQERCGVMRGICEQAFERGRPGLQSDPISRCCCDLEQALLSPRRVTSEPLGLTAYADLGHVQTGLSSRATVSVEMILNSA